MKLLVAALASELTAFPADLAGFDRLVTGPGKLMAAHALTRALERAEYDEILVVGTAGGLDPELEPGVHEINVAIQHDVIDTEGVIGQHVANPQRIELSAGDVVIATGDSFVDDVTAVAGIRALGGRLVDMEAYAYAWVAGQYDVPIRIWKAISDTAQDDANTTWEATVAVCSAQLRDRLQAEYGV